MGGQNGTAIRASTLPTASLSVGLIISFAFYTFNKASYASESRTNWCLTGLRHTITDEGVWRIKRRPRSAEIEVFKVEEVGHGDIITDEFMNWRIKLELRQTQSPAEDKGADE